jgi:hypothetical protein
VATSIGDLQTLVNQQGQQVSDLTAQQSAAYQAMLDRQNSQQQGLFGQYSDAIKNQTPLTAEYAKLQDQYGIPEANTKLQGYKDQVTRVQGLLNNLVPDINSRTSGTLTTQAMRDRIAAGEGNDLNRQISGLGTAMQPYADLISSGNQAISAYLPLFAQDQQTQLQPLTMQINALGDQFAREISGFNVNQENQLNGLMDKLNKQWTLSEADWQNAQQLAAQAANYNKYLQQQVSSNPAPNPLQQLPQLGAQGVYWVGADNNIYTKSSGQTGVKNIGPLGVAALPQGLSQISDPNPPAAKAANNSIVGKFNLTGQTPT